MSDGKMIAAGQQRLAKVQEADPAAAAAAHAGQPPEPEPAAPASPPLAEPGGPGAPGPDQDTATDRGQPEMWAVRIERREPEIPLNVNVPWGVRHGARLLALRKGIDQKTLVAEALRAYFAADDFTPPSFWDHA